MEDRCVICGEVIPEGRQVCLKCERMSDNEILKAYAKTATAEAIKEFAERLKERKYQSIEWSHGGHPFVVEEDDIDNLVQEMVGEENG